jgi:hypothetical protein
MTKMQLEDGKKRYRHVSRYYFDIIKYLYSLHNQILIIYYYVLQGHYMFRSIERPSSGGTQ